MMSNTLMSDVGGGRGGGYILICCKKGGYGVQTEGHEQTMTDLTIAILRGRAAKKWMMSNHARMAMHKKHVKNHRMRHNNNTPSLGPHCLSQAK